MGNTSGLFELNRLQTLGKKIEVRHVKFEGVDYALVSDELALLACGDRLLIKEDPFRTGYECTTCDGKGNLGVICPQCEGTKFDKGNSENGRCIFCTVGNAGATKTTGFVPCVTCKGSGTSSLVLPEDAERRPSSGIVISTGPDANKFKVGQRIVYSNYAGNNLDFKGVSAVRVMRQDEVMCLILSAKAVQVNEVVDSRMEEVGISK